jgi:hypothetical protein
MHFVLQADLLDMFPYRFRTLRFSAILSTSPASYRLSVRQGNAFGCLQTPSRMATLPVAVAFPLVVGPPRDLHPFVVRPPGHAKKKTVPGETGAVVFL